MRFMLNTNDTTREVPQKYVENIFDGIDMFKMLIAGSSNNAKYVTEKKILENELANIVIEK